MTPHKLALCALLSAGLAVPFAFAARAQNGMIKQDGTKKHAMKKDGMTKGYAMQKDRTQQ